jgi:hypothetical protein
MVDLAVLMPAYNSETVPDHDSYYYQTESKADERKYSAPFLPWVRLVEPWHLDILGLHPS